MTGGRDKSTLDQLGPFGYLRKARSDHFANQTEFGHPLGLTRWQVRDYETGGAISRTVTPVVKTVRDWLRTCGEEPIGPTAQELYLWAGLPPWLSDCPDCRHDIADRSHRSWGVCPHGRLFLPDYLTDKEVDAIRQRLGDIL